MSDITGKPRMGLLLIGAERFQKLGEGTKRGTYLQRQTEEAKGMVQDCSRIAEVVFPGIMFTRMDAEHSIRRFIEMKVDFVLALHLSWSEDFAWIRFLRDMPAVPILFAHRIKDRIVLGDTNDDDEFTEYLCYGGLVGALEASGDNARFKRPMFETMAGTWQEILKRLETFSIAAQTRSLLRNSTIGLLACYNEAMWSTYVDPYDVFLKAGPELHFLSISELVDEIALLDAAEVESIGKTLKQEYPMQPDVDQVKFLASVRASLAMERLAERNGIDLLVLNDIDQVLFKEVGLRPGFWPTSDQVKTLIVPEGDIGAGLSCYLLKLLSGKRVNFIEPFHIDLPHDNFAAGHAGPNDYREKGGATRIARDVRFAKTQWKYAGAPFAWHVFSEGEKTMLHCSQHDGRFLLAATRIESLPCEHFLATYSHGLFRAIGQTNARLFEKLLKLGVTQHYGIVDGNLLPEIQDVAKLLDFDYYEL